MAIGLNFVGAIQNISLVLGHGRGYEEEGYKGVRCSPVPLLEWVERPHVSVDSDAEVEPDILYDLTAFPWAFAADCAFSGIVDTCGLALARYYGKEGFRSSLFAKEIDRILRPGGV